MKNKSTNRDDYQTIPRPVGGLAKEFHKGFFNPAHQHFRAQLLYAVTGVLEVSTAQGSWVVPPQRAVWIPPETDHEVRFKTAASVRTLYIHPSALPTNAPALPCAVSVSALLRELILRAVSMPMEYDETGRDGKIVALALEEIEWTTDRPLHLPIFRDKRLAIIERALRHNPADQRSLEEWANEVNASSRTLARLFQAEAGTSFVHWRQQVRILASLPRLALGESITAIALDLGYETPGAFSTMFRRLIGVLPSRYF